MAWDFDIAFSIVFYGSMLALVLVFAIMLFTIHKDDCDRWDVLGVVKIEDNDTALLKTTTYQCLIGNVSSVVCNCNDTWLKRFGLP